MAIIEWGSNMSVGIGKIDEQHHKLIELMQELHEAIRKGGSADMIEDTIVNLFNYAQVHFATEEDLFRQHKYPEEKLHELEHSKFIAKAYEFREKFESNRMGLNLELLSFLSGWILGHIEITDKRYAKHLNGCGVT
jgi:hemerythrin